MYLDKPSYLNFLFYGVAFDKGQFDRNTYIKKGCETLISAFDKCRIAIVWKNFYRHSCILLTCTTIASIAGVSLCFAFPSALLLKKAIITVVAIGIFALYRQLEAKKQKNLWEHLPLHSISKNESIKNQNPSVSLYSDAYSKEVDELNILQKDLLGLQCQKFINSFNLNLSEQESKENIFNIFFVSKENPFLSSRPEEYPQEFQAIVNVSRQIVKEISSCILTLNKAKEQVKSEYSIVHANINKDVLLYVACNNKTAASISVKSIEEQKNLLVVNKSIHEQIVNYIKEKSGLNKTALEKTYNECDDLIKKYIFIAAQSVVRLMDEAKSKMNNFSKIVIEKPNFSVAKWQDISFPWENILDELALCQKASASDKTCQDLETGKIKFFDSYVDESSQELFKKYRDILKENISAF